MEVIIIAAMDPNRVIGKENKLPWDIPEDLQNFKKLTSGNTIVMGKNTFDSIGRPLPNRHNIVLSRSMGPREGIDVCKNIDEALEKGRSYGKDIFVIGGARVYEQMLAIADKLYLSHVKKEYEGDAFFPEFNKDEWEIEKREEHEAFEFVVYKRKQ